MKQTKTITLTNFKGGSGKTTSTAYFAAAFEQLGRSVLIVDADPHGQTLEWSEQADWQFPTIGLPAKNLHKKLPGIAGDRYDVVLIDTPPLEEQAGIVYAALHAADVVVLTMAPTMIELERAPHIMAAVEEVAAARDIEQNARFLLNRVVANAASTRVIRDSLTEQGHRVMTSTIPRREAIAQAFGTQLSGNLHGYLSAAKELEESA